MEAESLDFPQTQPGEGKEDVEMTEAETEVGREGAGNQKINLKVLKGCERQKHRTSACTAFSQGEFQIIKLGISLL